MWIPIGLSIVLICFVILVWRSVRAGHGLLLLWLAWMGFGLFPVFMLPADQGILAEGWFYLYIATVLCTPVYLVVRWIGRALRRSS